MRLGCSAGYMTNFSLPAGFNEAEANAPRMPRAGSCLGSRFGGFNEAEANAPRMRSCSPSLRP